MNQRNFTRYGISDTYLLRTPILPLEFSFKALVNCRHPSFIIKLLQDSHIYEALEYASPDLMKVLSSDQFNENPMALRHRKSLFALLKYLIRMGTRPTPFGLFAGIALGRFAEQTKIIRSEGTDYIRKNTIDAAAYEALVQEVWKGNKATTSQKWYRNSTLFVNGEEVRWLEFQNESPIWQYTLQTSLRNDALDSILEKARNGCTLDNLTDTLVELGHSRIDAKDYLTTLCNNAILESGMANNIFIPKLPGSLIHLIAPTSKVGKRLETISAALGDVANPHKEAEKAGALANPPMMVDVYPKYHSNNLRLSLKGQVMKSLEVVSRFSPQHSNQDFLDFVAAYKRRYGSREMRLVDVMDTDYGLGYPVGHHGNRDDFISCFDLKKKVHAPEKEPSLTAVELLLERKLRQRDPEGTVVQLSDEDIASLVPVEHGFGNSFFGLVEFLDIGDGTYIHPVSFGSSSATALHARFGFGNNDFFNCLQQIADVEADLDPNVITAEVAFCPSGKAANIAKRPLFRNYVIPYHHGGDLGNATPIYVDDLVLKPKNGSLELWSNSFCKKIIPFLSTAFNHHKETPPLYRFLGDFQFQGKRSYHYFSWGNLQKKYTFMPRIVYEDCLLSKASWRFQQKDLKNLFLLDIGDVRFDKATSTWAEENRLPRYIEWVEDDNTLLIDTQNNISMQLLFASVRSKAAFLVQEYFPPTKEMVRSSKGLTFVHQFQFNFYKKGLHRG